MTPPEGGAGSRRRVLPVLLAAGGVLLACAVLAWAVVGPSDEPAEVDLAALGLTVEEIRGAVPAVEVHDPTAVLERLRGWQLHIGGHLTLPVPAADGSWSAVITDGVTDDEIGFERALLGLVTWDGEGDDPDAVTSCALDDPVPVSAFDEAAESELGEDVHVDLRQLVGVCEGSQPVIAAPAVQVRPAPLSAVDRLRGRRARSALVPAGVVLADAGGVRSATDLPAALDGALVYPQEVAADALERAAPAAPLSDNGSWAQPSTPMAGRLDDALVWLVPVSPPDARETTVGYASVPAAELAAGRLAPVQLHWLPEPVAGHGAVVARVEALLAELGEDPSATGEIWVGPPGREGRVVGHVAEPFQLADDLPEVRYRIVGDGERVCLSDRNGEEVACSDAGS